MIGTHKVTFSPDPHSEQSWAPAFNPNSEFTTDLTGWWPGSVGSGNTWVWQGGNAAGSLPADRSGVLSTFVYPSNIAKPAGTALLRVTASVTLPTVPNTTDLILRLGYSLLATSNGWNVYHETRIKNPHGGAHTLELISDPASFPATYLSLRPEIRLEGPLTPALLSQSVTVDYLRVQSATADELTDDLTCLVDSVTIHHGRDDTNSQPEANSATLDMSLDTDEDEYPPTLEVGGSVRVTTATALGTFVRFVGRVTDIAQGWQPAGEDTPNRLEMQVIATGTLAELGRRTVGAAPWGQELDGARIARIMAAAGITLNPATSDPGTVQILPRDVDSQPALDVAQGVAESAGGIVWATREGDIRYADADHRRGTSPAVALDACDILVTPQWSRTTDGLINDVSIGYGATPAGGDQPRFTANRPDSIAAFGTYAFSSTTELAALADASAMGTLLLTRNRMPVWVMSLLPVDVASLDAERTAALLGLDMHSLLSLTGLPAAGSAPTSATLWVEGWTETLVYGGHEFTAVVSGYCRTSPAPRWDDVDPAQTWDSSGQTTWDDATCFGQTPNLGRWNDVPASLRWNQIAPAVTWDNYTP